MTLFFNILFFPNKQNVVRALLYVFLFIFIFVEHYYYRKKKKTWCKISCLLHKDSMVFLPQINSSPTFESKKYGINFDLKI